MSNMVLIDTGNINFKVLISDNKTNRITKQATAMK